MSLFKKLFSRIEYRWYGLKPSRLIARLNGKMVIANSIPKGGTHLLTRCLMFFPKLSYSGFHFVKGRAEGSDAQGILERTGKGRFSAAHLWWSEEVSMLLANRGVKQVVMVRDPRDIVVSGVWYIVGRSEHHLHDYFSGLSPKERIMAYICGVPAEYSTTGVGLADIRTSFLNYLTWEKTPNSIIVRFEDLIGSQGGGDRAEQTFTIGRIADHLGTSFTKTECENIGDKLFSKKSVTFRKGKLRDWVNHFDASHTAKFKEVTGDLLLSAGYEENNDW